MKFISRPPNGQIWVMSRNLGSSSLSSLLNSKIPKYNFLSEISMVLPIFTWENYLVEFIDSSASLATLAPFIGPVPHECFLFLKSRIFKMQSFLRGTKLSFLSKWPIRCVDLDFFFIFLEFFFQRCFSFFLIYLLGILRYIF